MEASPGDVSRSKVPRSAASQQDRHLASWHPRVRVRSCVVGLWAKYIDGVRVQISRVRDGAESYGAVLWRCGQVRLGTVRFVLWLGVEDLPRICGLIVLERFRGSVCLFGQGMWA
jgi:hypothetical protein